MYDLYSINKAICLFDSNPGLPLSCSAFFLELSVLLTRTRRAVILLQSELTPDGPVLTVWRKYLVELFRRKNEEDGCFAPQVRQIKWNIFSSCTRQMQQNRLGIFPKTNRQK